ncbi:MAG TPA: PEP-CTERM sorting domain-containing protein, partial [Planctomycetota bacterium]|nr:PEP-CTERM sorting domain-containing protein [Planctomycetota bacterium]
LGGGVSADPIPITIVATAEERGGLQPDVFGVSFFSPYNVRIRQIIYDLSFAAGNLYFDTVPHGSGAYDFTVLPDSYFPTIISDDVGVWSYTSQDNSPLLVLNFNDFRPGKVLSFAIDVDTWLGGAFTPTEFAGTYMGIVIDLEPAFPGADPQGVIMVFQNRNEVAIAEFRGGVEVSVPEPTTVALMAGGLAYAGLRTGVRFRKRNRKRSCT